MTKRALYILYILLLTTIFLTACSDDDFAPYTYYTKETDIQIKSLPISISSLEDEVTSIADKYDKNTKLSRVIITFNNVEQINNRKGNIDFYFYKSNDNKNINQATSIILRFNMETNKVYEIKFEKGHGKRVGGVETLIDKDNSEKLLKDIFKVIEDNDEYTNKVLEVNPSLEFEFIDKRLYIFLYNMDKNEGPVFRYQEESD